MTHRLHSLRRLNLMLSAAAVAFAAPVYAQAQDAAPTASSQSMTLENIVVTARKREESLMDVPIAVSAFDSLRMEDRLVQSIVDIAEFTPGFQIQEAFGRNGDRPVIRGASNILMAEGKVGVFLNGVPYLGDFSSLDLANVERVEVIKGPQSAVFGRGTLSGAVNVVLKRPGEELEGQVTANVGNYNRKEFSAFLSTPVTPWLGVQAGFKFYDVNGQYDNALIPGERLGDEKTHQYMAGVFLDPTPDISASVQWIHQKDDDGHYAIGLQPASENNCFLDTRQYYCGEVQVPKSYGINTDRLMRPGLYRNADRFIGDIRWDIMGSGYEASFQVGYSDMVQVVGTDQSFDDRNFFLFRGACAFIPIGNQDCSQSPFNTTDGLKRETETYEWRLTSPGADRFRWRVGVFTSRDRVKPNPDYVEATEVGLDILPDATRVKNLAFFGGIDLDVTEDLTIGAELRRQIDKVRSTGVTYRAGDLFSDEELAELLYPNPDQIVGTAGERNAKFKATLPRVTVNWSPARDWSVYAQYSQGNSPGGFNPLTAPTTTYDEEKLINYEIGFKTSKFGFDYLNVSAFWQNYKNQVLTNTYVTETLIDSYKANIGKTRIRGIEVEGALPLANRMFTLQFNYTYLDAKIREGVEPDHAVLLLGATCKTGSAINLDLPGCREAASIVGQRPPLVSKHNGAIGLRFDHEIGNGWAFFSGIDVIYRSRFYAQVHNLAHTGDATKVNLQAGVTDNNGWRVTAYGKNVLGNETPDGIMRYIDLGVPAAATGDSVRAFSITPPSKAEWGVIVRKAF